MAARYTARLSGVDVLAVMLLDVLSELPELKICTAYELDGRRITDFPSHVDDLRRVVPVYETLPGWQKEISDVRRIGDLPANARKYLDRLSQLLGRPVEVVSVGPGPRADDFCEVKARDRNRVDVALQASIRLVAFTESCPTTSPTELSDVPRERLPRHIAVIMDGNGRWARQRGLPRIEGHRRGATSVRRVTEECARLGIEQLTLYCLSSENWKRPAEELDFLMQLLQQYMVEERPAIMEHNIRVTVIGRREGLPADALANWTRRSA